MRDIRETPWKCSLVDRTEEFLVWKLREKMIRKIKIWILENGRSHTRTRVLTYPVKRTMVWRAGDRVLLISGIDSPRLWQLADVDNFIHTKMQLSNKNNQILKFKRKRFFFQGTFLFCFELCFGAVCFGFSVWNFIFLLRFRGWVERWGKSHMVEVRKWKIGTKIGPEGESNSPIKCSNRIRTAIRRARSRCLACQMIRSGAIIGKIVYALWTATISSQAKTLIEHNVDSRHRHRCSLRTARAEGLLPTDPDGDSSHECQACQPASQLRHSCLEVASFFGSSTPCILPGDKGIHSPFLFLLFSILLFNIFFIFMIFF